METTKQRKVDSAHRAPSAGRTDFRLYLQAELSRRCKEIPGYSLRSFAKMLKIDPSALAKILKGTRPVGERLIKKLGTCLDLNLEEIQEFKVKSKAVRDHNVIDSVVPEYQQLTLDTFRIVSDWYHYAILELIRVDGFRPSPKWISKALRVPLIEVNFAIERLVRSELLEITADGKWIDRSEIATNISQPFYDSAQRKLQKQILEKAIHAIEQIPVAKRDQTSMTMAIDANLLPEAKEKIKKFRRELAQFLSRGDTRNEVYHLGISLYPVSEIEN